MFNEVREVREHIDYLLQDGARCADITLSLLSEIWPVSVLNQFLPLHPYVACFYLPIPFFHCSHLPFIPLLFPRTFLPSYPLFNLPLFLSSYHLHFSFFFFWFISVPISISVCSHSAFWLGLLWFPLISSSTLMPSHPRYKCKYISNGFLIITPAKWSLPVLVFSSENEIKRETNQDWRGFKYFHIKGTWRGQAMWWW